MMRSPNNRQKHIASYEENLRTKSADYWLKNGKQRFLDQFHAMAERVPAYKKFLATKGIIHENIKTASDFTQIPRVDKDMYLRAFTLPELCWDGKFAQTQWVVSTTSGSTGKPFYFPRQTEQDLQYALMAELYLLNNFDIKKRTTLYVVGFPMGAWIGGVFTYEAIKTIADSGKYPLSIITPGIHKQEVLKAVKELGKYYDQIIIGSYGPFLKDIIDDGTREGLDWSEYNVKFIFSAEGFTETFRDYVLKRAGLDEVKNQGEYLRSSLNHYGTVDLGTMSYETPLSIYLRRLTLRSKALYRNVFGDTIKLPTLTQYDPTMFYFEEEDGRLLCSASSGLPLVRYDLKDRGGIVQYEDMMSIFKNHGIDVEKEMSRIGLKKTLWKLPFVYVYERDDFSVSFYAFQIYPETIRRAVQIHDLSDSVTGKFTMLVKFDKGSNQYFEVNVELKSGIRKSKDLQGKIQQSVFDHLMKDSSEYKATYAIMKEKALPRIVLWKYEDVTYFKPGTKQKWVERA